MESEINGIIGEVYEDPATHWFLVRIDHCECHGSSRGPHVLRIRELPVDEEWLKARQGKRVRIVTSVQAEAVL